MTPNEVQALIGIWRRQLKEGSATFHAEDVAVEVSLYTGRTYGKTRAANALRSLAEKKLVKETKWDGFTITGKGRALCEAVRELGLCEFV